MSLMARLASYERQILERWGSDGWDKRRWPSGAHAGMDLLRLHRTLPNGDQIMLHRFMPDSGEQDPHAHPKAVAAHVLGPGSYEVGFVVNGVCQARMVSSQPFYYEMISPDVQHFVLPSSGPIYSVAMWSSYPKMEKVPGERLMAEMEPAEELLQMIEDAFVREWGVDPGERLCRP